MVIYVGLFGGLEDLLGAEKKNMLGEDGSLLIPDGAMIRDLLERLGLPEKKAQILLVNGIHQRSDYVLQERDRISLFPLLGGG